MSQQETAVIENPVMNDEETKVSLDCLINKFGFTQEFISMSQNYKNLKFGIEYMVRVGKALSMEFEEWCNSNPTKKIYIRLIFVHPQTKKTFFEAIIKAKLLPTDLKGQDIDDNNSSDNQLIKTPENFTIGKKYYLRKMEELDPSILDDEFILSDGSDDNKQIAKFKTVCQDSKGLENIPQKLFWDVIKYLVYHESILEYKILVENAEDK